VAEEVKEKERESERANYSNELTQKLVEENKALQQRIAELELALKTQSVLSHKKSKKENNEI